MLKKLNVIIITSALLALASSAQAITPAPIKSTENVTLVAQHCGHRFHKSIFGQCVLNHAPSKKKKDT